MSDLSPAALARIEELLAKATPAPWYVAAPSSMEYGGAVADTRSWLSSGEHARELTQVRCAERETPQRIQDAVLIAEIRNAAPSLLAAARRNAELEAICREFTELSLLDNSPHSCATCSGRAHVDAYGDIDDPIAHDDDCLLERARTALSKLEQRT